MSDKLSQHEESIIEQLKEENKRLKLLIQEKINNPNKELSEKLSTETDPFEKARFISNIAYWKYSIKNNKL